MTALTLIRVPRRMFRKVAKPFALWLNTMRREHSEMEVFRLQMLRAALAEAEGAQHIRQVQIMQDRRAVEAW
jgi:hypothetical protein